MDKKRFKVRLAVFLVFEYQGLLLIRRYNTGHRDGELSLPSGHVEEGESPKKAMIREAREEIRVVIPNEDCLHLVHTQYNAESGTGREYINLYFVVTQWTGTPQIGEPDQCSEIIRVDRGPTEKGWELPNDVVPYVRVALESYARGRQQPGLRVTYSEVGF